MLQSIKRLKGDLNGLAKLIKKWDNTLQIMQPIYLYTHMSEVDGLITGLDRSNTEIHTIVIPYFRFKQQQAASAAALEFQKKKWATAEAYIKSKQELEQEHHRQMAVLEKVSQEMRDERIRLRKERKDSEALQRLLQNVVKKRGAQYISDAARSADPKDWEEVESDYCKLSSPRGPASKEDARKTLNPLKEDIRRTRVSEPVENKGGAAVAKDKDLKVQKVLKRTEEPGMKAEANVTDKEAQSIAGHKRETEVKMPKKHMPKDEPLLPQDKFSKQGKIPAFPPPSNKTTVTATRKSTLFDDATPGKPYKHEKHAPSITREENKAIKLIQSRQRVKPIEVKTAQKAVPVAADSAPQKNKKDEWASKRRGNETDNSTPTKFPKWPPPKRVDTHTSSRGAPLADRMATPWLSKQNEDSIKWSGKVEEWVESKLVKSFKELWPKQPGALEDSTSLPSSQTTAQPAFRAIPKPHQIVGKFTSLDAKTNDIEPKQPAGSSQPVLSSVKPIQRKFREPLVPFKPTAHMVEGSNPQHAGAHRLKESKPSVAVVAAISASAGAPPSTVSAVGHMKQLGKKQLGMKPSGSSVGL